MTYLKDVGFSSRVQNSEHEIEATNSSFENPMGTMFNSSAWKNCYDSLAASLI